MEHPLAHASARLRNGSGLPPSPPARRPAHSEPHLLLQRVQVELHHVGAGDQVGTEHRKRMGSRLLPRISEQVRRHPRSVTAASRRPPPPRDAAPRRTSRAAAPAERKLKIGGVVQREALSVGQQESVSCHARGAVSGSTVTGSRDRSCKASLRSSGRIAYPAFGNHQSVADLDVPDVGTAAPSSTTWPTATPRAVDLSPAMPPQDTTDASSTKAAIDRATADLPHAAP